MFINEIGNKIYESLLSSFTEECTVPAYIIHQSHNSDDYLIYFQVEAMTENLRNGIFIRPKIEIWSGRSDLDRTKLAKSLRVEFIHQLEKEKQEKLQEHHKQQKEVSENTETMKGNLISKISWLGSAVAAALLVSNPIANAVILFIAVTSGKSALSEVIKMLRLSMSSWSADKINKEKEKELEDEINNKSEAIDEALEHIDIKLHPALYKAAHNHYGIAATSAKGMVINADPLPEFINSLISTDDCL